MYTYVDHGYVQVIHLVASILIACISYLNLHTILWTISHSGTYLHLNPDNIICDARIYDVMDDLSISLTAFSVW